MRRNALIDPLQCRLSQTVRGLARPVGPLRMRRNALMDFFSVSFNPSVSRFGKAWGAFKNASKCVDGLLFSVV